MFEFSIKTKVKFGCGVRFNLPELLEKEHLSDIGVVVDHNITELPIITDLLNQLDKTTKQMAIAKCTISEPTYDSLEEMRLTFNNSNLQAFIGIGGGSALDMAKAMAVLVHNRKSAVAYRGVDQMTEPVLPIIAVPTTAGTGSEVTPNASFIDSKEKKKLGINGEAVRPLYAFLDPELTLSCPKYPTISAGVDSMVHSVEAFVAKKTNRMARFFAAEGFNRVFAALPRLVDDLNNVEMREEVMFGAFLSGIALMHSGTGPAAAMSYPLSVHFHVPHGIGGGLFLPHVIKHNIKAGYSDYAYLYNPTRLEPMIALGLFLDSLQEVWEKLNIPGDLSAFNIQRTDILLIINETMQLKGALDQNPTPFYEREIESLLNVMTEVKSG